MFKLLFHILIFATNNGSGKYQNKEKPLKCQRKLGLGTKKTGNNLSVSLLVDVHLQYSKNLSQGQIKKYLCLKARVWSSKIPTGRQLSQYGKWDGLILSLLSYQFEFYWLLLDCKQKHMVTINIVC